MEYSRTFAGASARDAVLQLISDSFAADFAEAIPVTLLGSDAQEVGPDSWLHVMTCEFETTSFDLPGVVSKVLPALVRLTWSQSWTVHADAAAAADLRIATEGTPSATTVGRARLAGAGDGLTYSFQGSTTVSVPLMGGTLGGMVDEHLVGRILDDQVKVLTARLS